MNNYDELRQRIAVTRERVEMAEHESNCLVYGIVEPHECSCVVGELADLVSDLLDENVALREKLTTFDRWPDLTAGILVLAEENAALRAALRNVLLADAVVIDDEQVEWPLWEARKALGDAS